MWSQTTKIDINDGSLVKTYEVRPINGRVELLAVLLTAIVVFMVSASIIALRQRPQQQKSLETYQLNAFQKLKSSELGIFNDLYTAADEINDSHIDNGESWVTVQDLEKEFVPPFVRDLAWKKRGKMIWNSRIQNNSAEHIVMYLGYTKTNQTIGSFLLVCIHKHEQPGISKKASHAPFEIWYHKQQTEKVDFPLYFSDYNLITNGWKEVVAYKGEDELARLKEKEYL